MDRKLRWALVFVLLIAVMIVFFLATGDVKLSAAMAIINGFASAIAFIFAMASPKDK